MRYNEMTGSVREEFEKNVIKLHKNGETPDGIVEKHEISMLDVYKILKKNSEDFELVGGSKAERMWINEKIVDLYEYGTTVNQLKDMFGYSRVNIMSILEKHNIKMRSDEDQSITKEDILSVLVKYIGGKKVCEIVKEVDILEVSVNKILADSGIRCGMLGIDENEVVKEMLEGIGSVGDRHGISSFKLIDILIKRGIEVLIGEQYGK